MEIASKQLEIPTLKVLPYTASIDRSLLKSLFFIGKFDVIAADITQYDLLSDEHIKTYVKSLVSSTDISEIDPDVIEKALEGFSMPNSISNADARITHFCADFFERLEAFGYDEVVSILES